MKIIITKFPQYLELYEVRVKKWWGWKEVFSGSKDECTQVVENLRKNGTIYEVVLTTETKN